MELSIFVQILGTVTPIALMGIGFYFKIGTQLAEVKADVKNIKDVELKILKDDNQELKFDIKQLQDKFYNFQEKLYEIDKNFQSKFYELDKKVSNLDVTINILVAHPEILSKKPSAS